MMRTLAEVCLPIFFLGIRAFIHAHARDYAQTLVDTCIMLIFPYFFFFADGCVSVCVCVCVCVCVSGEHLNGRIQWRRWNRIGQSFQQVSVTRFIDFLETHLTSSEFLQPRSHGRSGSGGSGASSDPVRQSSLEDLQVLVLRDPIMYDVKTQSKLMH